MILTYSANLGNFDKVQEVDYCFTDENFPPRFKSMTPRLQARLVKMFGWQLKPGYDFYLWVDSSCRLKEGSVEWFMKQLGGADMAVFKHNRRNTVQEEADYLKSRLQAEREGRKDKYVLPRYENEDIDGAIEGDPNARLYASTAFIYRNVTGVQKALKEWWISTARFHSIDQLSLPNAIKDVSHNVIEEDYLKCKFLEYTR